MCRPTPYQNARNERYLKVIFLGDSKTRISSLLEKKASMRTTNMYRITDDDFRIDQMIPVPGWMMRAPQIQQFHLHVSNEASKLENYPPEYRASIYSGADAIAICFALDGNSGLDSVIHKVSLQLFYESISLTTLLP